MIFLFLSRRFSRRGVGDFTMRFWGAWLSKIAQNMR